MNRFSHLALRTLSQFHNLHQYRSSAASHNYLPIPPHPSPKHAHASSQNVITRNTPTTSSTPTNHHQPPTHTPNSFSQNTSKKHQTRLSLILPPTPSVPTRPQALAETLTSAPYPPHTSTYKPTPSPNVPPSPTYIVHSMYIYTRTRHPCPPHFQSPSQDRSATSKRKHAEANPAPSSRQAVTTRRARASRDVNWVRERIGLGYSGMADGWDKFS